MTGGEEVWVARLTPVSGGVAALLATPLGLDVWERGDDHLVVMATELQLAELERRRMARVERLGTRDQFVARRPPGPTREDD